MHIESKSPKIHVLIEPSASTNIQKRFKTEKLSIINKLRRKFRILFPYILLATKTKQGVCLLISALMLGIYIISWTWTEIITNKFIAYPMLSTWLSRYSSGMLYSLTKLLFIDDPIMS